MGYEIDDTDYEDMDDLALPDHIEYNHNQSEKSSYDQHEESSLDEIETDSLEYISNITTMSVFI